MKTILAVAVLLAVTACENSPYMRNYGPGGRYEGQDPYAAMIVNNGGLIRPYSPPATAPAYQPRQPVTCYPAGYNVTCY